ncbi:Rho GTPase activation protein [Protomyces lactucae-debilis]|uniref:Rho GTPase activation protein n=1 Tax=Protomyces lactucae-debilis TaxID=2754530 RepID=A0A1Y2FI49_PROLT|nr:Rho GTPase activation protein [Protomyces lactucae-debilis]ORY82485.1 Rho GTPase activation protein [Protomyces lactucae-debilis]
MFKKLLARGKQLVQSPQKGASDRKSTQHLNGAAAASNLPGEFRDTVERPSQPPSSPKAAQRHPEQQHHEPATRPVFGVAIDIATCRSRLSSTVPLQDADGVDVEALFRYWLPGVVCQSLDYLDAYVAEEGLYRVPGSTHMVQSLQHSYDISGSIQLESIAGLQIADVASLFKLYLRELPQRLINQVLASRLEQAIASDAAETNANQSTTLCSLLRQLRPYEFYLLRRLCEHLFRVQAVAETSKMTISNLCIVFCSSSNLGIGANVLSKLIAAPDVWQGLRSDGEIEAISLEKEVAFVAIPDQPLVLPTPMPAEDKARIKADRRKSIWPIRKS